MQNPIVSRVQSRRFIRCSFFFILLVLFSLPLTVQAWTRIIALDDNETGRKVLQTNDGGYLIGSNSDESNLPYFIRLTADGGFVWTYSDDTGSPGYNPIGGICQLPSGTFCYCGLSTDSISYMDVYIATLDSNGSQSRTPLGVQAIPHEMVRTSDSGFVIAGRLPLLNAVGAGFALKTAASGTVEWNQMYGMFRGLYSAFNVYSLSQSQNNGFIAAGVLSVYLSYPRMGLMRIDSVGDTVWTKYPGAGIIYSIVRIPDGGYIACGDDTLANAVVLRLNNDGDTVWTRSYPACNAFSICNSSDSAVVISGAASGSVSSIFLKKISWDGSTLWTQNYFGNDSATGGFSVCQASDGGFITVGSTNGEEVTSVYIVKTDADGNAGVNEHQSEQLPTSCSLSQNYPNPFNPTTTIRYSLTATGLVDLRVFDMTGRTVATLAHERQAAGSYEVTFDASNLASGIYFYRLQTNRTTAMRKMVLVK